MGRPFTLNSRVEIPVVHNGDVISVSLAQEGAVEIAYGIRLYYSKEPKINHRLSPSRLQRPVGPFR